MTASSISTYLDVTRAATGSPLTKSAPMDPDALAQAAKVLAAVHAGTEVTLADLAQQTGLDVSQLLALLASLTNGGLVEADEQEGVVHVRLTEPTRAALTA